MVFWFVQSSWAVVNENVIGKNKEMKQKRALTRTMLRDCRSRCTHCLNRELLAAPFSMMIVFILAYCITVIIIYDC
jgi:hypothetical protein